MSCTVYLYAYVYVYKRGRLIKIILKLYEVNTGPTVVLLALTRGRSKVLYKADRHGGFSVSHEGDVCVLTRN